MSLDCPANRIGIVGFVGVKDATARHPLEKVFGRPAVRRLATSETEGDRPAVTVGQGVDFGCAPATRAADRLLALPPLPPAAQRCAFTTDESIRIVAGGPPAAARAWKMSIQTPFVAQRTKRLESVLCGP